MRDFWEKWEKHRRPKQDADALGLRELTELYSRSFGSLGSSALTPKELTRRDHLASHLRQRITLNPGPSDTGEEGDTWKRWEEKARWVLSAIALNPDGHHWSYVAAAIQEAVEEAMKESKC